MHIACIFDILYQKTGVEKKKSKLRWKRNFLPPKIELGKACQANISAHSVVSQRDFLCSFSQETQESSSSSVLYSWVFAIFLRFRNLSFIAHFSSLYVFFQTILLQTSAACGYPHCLMIGWSFSINTEFLSHAETNILFRKFFASYCRLQPRVRVCV